MKTTKMSTHFVLFYPRHAGRVRFGKGVGQTVGLLDTTNENVLRATELRVSTTTIRISV